MDLRRVQRVGLKTLSVSLPSRWVKMVGLKQGDTVVFTQEPDGSLRIRPSSMAAHKEPEEAVIYSDLCDEPSLLERLIVGNYILGHDVIRIVSSRSIRGSHLEVIRKVAEMMIGMAVVEERPNEVVLLCSIDVSKFPIQTVIRRLYIIVSTMIKEVTQALMNLDTELAKETVRRDVEADKIYWLTLRLLMLSQKNSEFATKLNIDVPLQILGYRAIAQHLERVGDWAETLARHVIEMGDHKDEIDPKLFEPIIRFSEKVQEMCYRAIQSLFIGSIPDANSVVNEYKRELEQMETSILNDLHTKFSRLRRPLVICPHIVHAFKRVAEIAAEIAEISINRALERPSRFSEVITREELPQL